MLIVVVALTLTSVGSTYARTRVKDMPEEQWLNVAGRNNILFYNPFERRMRDCSPTSGAVDVVGGNTTFVADGNEHGHWEGGCSDVSPHSTCLSKYVGPIRTAAGKNGVPWEAMAAQLIIESGCATQEVCPNNPLGLKGEGPSCDGAHRTFNSHEEAFDWYFQSILPVKRSAGKFSQNPFSYIEFIEYGDPLAVYATDPEYVTKVSNVVCGVQKWAEARGIPISAENYHNFKTDYATQNSNETTNDGNTADENADTDGDDANTTAVTTPTPDYCFGEGGITGSEIVDEGGLTYEQAVLYVQRYGANMGGESEAVVGSALWFTNQYGRGGTNCVTFSAFFVKKGFSSLNGNAPWGNGDKFVDGLSGGVMSGTPSVGSVLSVSNGGSLTHTAVVLGIHDGQYILGEADYGMNAEGAGNGTYGSGSAYVSVKTGDPMSWWSGATYIKFYTPASLDLGALEGYVNGA